jgi:endonuclease YncB( thermonuclease family)
MTRWVAGLALVAAVATGVLVSSMTPAVPAQGADRDCADFGTQREAQQYFESIGGPGSDPDRLDGDGDGRACDTLPCPCGSGGPRPRPQPQPRPAPRPREKPDARQTIKARIIDVIDGDTIKVRPLEAARRPAYTVRLIGIDAPETRRSGSPVECGGREATHLALDLSFSRPRDTDDDGLLDRPGGRGRRVLLATDPTQGLFDRFDRLLAYAKLRGGPDLATTQLRRGWAKVYVFRRRFERHPSFVRAQGAARRQDRGVWGNCGESPPVRDRPQSGCDPSYPSVCIPPPPPDRDCSQVSETNFAVVGSDPHGFDGDGDGVGCES